MDDPYFSVRTGPDRYLCLAPLDRDALDGLNVDGLGDDLGYFIYEAVGRTSPQCVNVLAKCPSYEAASRLLELYNVSMKSRLSVA